MPMEEQSMISVTVRPLIGTQHTLGHDVIDGDHWAIAGGWYRAVNCEQIHFPFLIAQLKKLMRVHFDHEIALMEAAGGMLCECHRQEHQTLLNVCDQATVLSAKNWQRTQSLLRNKFPKLIRNHIACTDQIAVLFINANSKTAQMQ
jgi:hemerythrin